MLPSRREEEGMEATLRELKGGTDIHPLPCPFWKISPSDSTGS